MTASARQTIDDELPVPTSVYRKGDRVEHDLWGEGLVLDIRGAGEECRLTVSFPRVGIKRLVARFVRPIQGGDEPRAVISEADLAWPVWPPRYSSFRVRSATVVERSLRRDAADSGGGGS